MTVLSYQTLRDRRIIHPWVEREEIETSAYGALSHGAGPASYDVCLDLGGFNSMQLEPGGFLLAATLERFSMPDDVCATVHDKSTWARLGLSAFNTFIDPGWCGFLTLELSNRSRDVLLLKRGDPIVQIKFEFLDAPTEHPYSGKYQNQARGPQEAR